MLYAICVAVALVVIVPFVRLLWTGNSFATSLGTGDFYQSQLGCALAAWFKERCERVEQRALFVQAAIGLCCPSDVVAERLMGCIMNVWRGDGARFGDLLAVELDKLIVFDHPKDQENAELQQVVLLTFDEFKMHLRSLDGAACSST